MTAKQNDPSRPEDLDASLNDVASKQPDAADESTALSAEDEAYAAELGRRVADDGSYTAGFKPAPHVDGEFRVPLSRLREWEHHPRRGSRELGEHASALALSAENPDALPPIVVLPATDNAYPIVNGRFLWAALKAVHDGNEDVEVRCVLFNGTEAEAVESVCDTALGTVGFSAIEQAQVLLSLQRVSTISQTAIAERYRNLTVSKVSNMLIAAKMKEMYPALFDILREPDRAPISYGVAIGKLFKALPMNHFLAVLDRAEDVIANGDRCKPGEVFEVLQVEFDEGGEASTPAPAKVKPIVPVRSEPLFGDDDQPVAAFERLSDGIDRLRLPDVGEMSLAQREAAADACIAQIRRHFGLDVEG